MSSIKQLSWITGGMGSAAYAPAFGHPRYYRIEGEPGNWTLSHPHDGAYLILTGNETQIAARRLAQANYENHITAGLITEPAATPAPGPRLSGAALRAQYEKDLSRIIDEWEQRREVCLADPEARARFLILRSFDLSLATAPEVTDANS